MMILNAMKDKETDKINQLFVEKIMPLIENISSLVENDLISLIENSSLIEDKSKLIEEVKRLNQDTIIQLLLPVALVNKYLK